MPKQPPKPWWRYIQDSLGDHVLQILIAAAFVALVSGMIEDPNQGWMEGAAILFAIVIVVSVQSSNEYSKAKQFRKLNAQAENREVSVIRSGADASISVYSVVVGDLLHISTGEILPVDGVLVRCNGIVVDESSLTGESEQITKTSYRSGDSQCNPFLFSGSRVTEGNGLLLVCAVGLNSYQGHTQVMMEESEEEHTPLQDKLDIIADDIGKIGIGAGFLTFLALMMYVIFDLMRGGWNSQATHDFLDSFIIMVTIIVVAVPEGLPLAVTLSLAYSVGKMRDENNFVRHLHACETMGGADNICTDKTGTMTENKMEVVQFFIDDHTAKSADEVAAPLRDLLGLSICHNSTAFIATTPEGGEVRTGNPTETALLSLAIGWGYDYKVIRTPEAQVLQIPFSSDRKRMSTVVKLDSGLCVFVKGAPEMILPNCKSVATTHGEVE